MTEGAEMDLGRVVYESYLVSCDGKSIRGEDLPTWEGQAPEIRAHWRAVADGVKMFLEMRTLQGDRAVLRTCGQCGAVHPEHVSVPWVHGERLYFCTDTCHREWAENG